MRFSHVDPNTEFEIVDPGNGRYQIVSFLGDFQGRPVKWTARILARGEGQGSYINIDQIKAGIGEIEIGLPVERIDVPTINKTVVMIRQYKKLTLGRHDFGAKVNN